MSPPLSLGDLTARFAGSWTLDPDKSAVRFTHATMWGIVKVRGSFTGLRGRGTVGPDGTVTGSVSVDAASIDTHNKMRDRHLRSEDFLDSATYPDITFVARSAHPGEPALVVDGVLTVASVTRAVEIPVAVQSADVDTVILEAGFEVDRADYGMTSNRIGMIRGRTALHVVARFRRSGGSG